MFLLESGSYSEVLDFAPGRPAVVSGDKLPAGIGNGWIVVASAPVSSANRRAALPVGAHSRTDLRLARYFGVSEGFFLGLQADFELLERRRKIAQELRSIRPRAA